MAHGRFLQCNVLTLQGICASAGETLDSIQGVHGIEWLADTRTLLYTTADALLRPSRVSALPSTHTLPHLLCMGGGGGIVWLHAIMMLTGQTPCLSMGPTEIHFVSFSCFTGVEACARAASSC